MFKSVLQRLLSAFPGNRAPQVRRQPAHRKPLARRRPGGLEVVRLESRELLAGVWTQLSNLAPSETGTSTMMLLSDGTVMVQGGGNPPPGTKTWDRLTPDATGRYVTWPWG